MWHPSGVREGIGAKLRGCRFAQPPAIFSDPSGVDAAVYIGTGDAQFPLETVEPGVAIGKNGLGIVERRLIFHEIKGDPSEKHDEIGENNLRPGDHNPGVRCSKWLMVALFAGTAAVFCVQSPQPDDEAVVNAALGTFFRSAEWNRGAWEKGDFAVVEAKWARIVRGSFMQEIDEAIKWYSRHKSTKPASEKLRKLKQTIRDMGSPFKPERPIPLSQLKLDARILVGTQTELAHGDRYYGWHPGVLKVKGHRGKEGLVRAIGKLHLPCYSKDGQLAALRMSGLPSSIHSAELVFFLRRSGTEWAVVHVRPIIYL